MNDERAEVNRKTILLSRDMINYLWHEAYGDVVDYLVGRRQGHKVMIGHDDKYR